MRTQRSSQRLCSACDPEIAAWHGQFERISADEYLRRWPSANIEWRARNGTKALNRHQT